jgi:hypothetical protein
VFSTKELAIYKSYEIRLNLLEFGQETELTKSL